MYTSELKGSRPTGHLLAAGALAALLGACAGTGDPVSAPPPEARAGAPVSPVAGARHYQVVPGDSAMELHVFRDGRLARLGHNHVIASTAIEGDLWLAQPVADSVVELVIDKDSLTVDEPSRRRAAGEEFASEPPPDAIAGTRANMLGPDLLNAAQFPAVALRTVEIRGELPDLTLNAQIVVNDTPRSLVLPLTVTRDGERLTATGDLIVTHSDLALEPFSVMLGALRVREEMHLYYSIVAEPTEI